MKVAHGMEGPLSTMLPDPQQELLARSALWARESARHALLEWQGGEPRPARGMARQGRLLAPLISANVGAPPAELDGRLVTYLRTALVREELRGAEYRRILSLLLDAFARSGVSLLLFEGAALAERAYPRPDLRHTHGISAMLADADAGGAAGILPEAGFRVTGGRDDQRGVLLRAVHESGLQLTLRFGPMPFPRWGRFAENLWRRSEERVLLGSPTRVLSAADALWQVCARAATGQRRETLLWTCDAWFLLARETPEWDVLLEHATRTDTSASLCPLFGWLAESIGVPVPDDVLDRLALDAERADRTARQVALTGAGWRPGPKLIPFLRAARSWRERMEIVRWRFLPSSATLVGTGQIRTRASAPLFLVTRPARLALVKLRGRLRRGGTGFNPPAAPRATSARPS